MEKNLVLSCSEMRPRKMHSLTSLTLSTPAQVSQMPKIQFFSKVPLFLSHTKPKHLIISRVISLSLVSAARAVTLLTIDDFLLQQHVKVL